MTIIIEQSMMLTIIFTVIYYLRSVGKTFCNNNYGRYGISDGIKICTNGGAESTPCNATIHVVAASPQRERNGLVRASPR
jgi:hypothetical protein